MKELIYIEHFAGDFEQGLQVCIHCGKVISDYTGDWVSSDNGWSPSGFPRGLIYTSGNMTTTGSVLENYGCDDPYKRVIKKCTEQ